jgi:hypothetical protein
MIMVKKRIFELPNPEAKRSPIIKECLGGLEYEAMEKKGYERKRVKKVTSDCSRIFTLADGKKVCCAYENPAAIHRRGCALGDNKPEGIVEEKSTLKRKFKKKTL